MGISDRDLAILKLVAQGFDNTSIASHLGILPHQVRNGVRGYTRKHSDNLRQRVALAFHAQSFLSPEEWTKLQAEAREKWNCVPGILRRGVTLLLETWLRPEHRSLKAEQVSSRCRVPGFMRMSALRDLKHFLGVPSSSSAGGEWTRIVILYHAATRETPAAP